MQLLQWMISLTTGTSWESGAGTMPRPGIKGFIGVIPVIIPRLGSKSGGRGEISMRPLSSFLLGGKSNTCTVTFKHLFVSKS